MQQESESTASTLDDEGVAVLPSASGFIRPGMNEEDDELESDPVTPMDNASASIPTNKHWHTIIFTASSESLLRLAIHSMNLPIETLRVTLYDVSSVWIGSSSSSSSSSGPALSTVRDTIEIVRGLRVPFAVS